jgi:nicotinate-nucleotide adenylyltransferase
MPEPARERIGVLGGTFDPVHTAHIVAACAVLDRLRLERVLFVVAGDPWQKRGRVVASADDRIELVRLAVEEIDGLETSAVEIESGRASVTADTLELLAAPDRELYLLLGADAVENMSTWRRLGETRQLATVVVVERVGERAVPPGPGWKVEHVAIPRLDISSTEIRDRLAAGRPIDGLVPPAVVRSIRSRGLYTRS